MRNVRPLLHRHIQAFLDDRASVRRAASLHDGPVHMLFPQIMGENIARLREAFQKAGVKADILFAHKANGNAVFARQAWKEGIGIDVASLPELLSAFGAGFCGCVTGCTGPKKPEYLLLALQQECTISVDSLGELETIRAMLGSVPHLDGAKILLRVADPVRTDRTVRWKNSRFGIPRAEIPRALDILQSEQRMRLRGFHFHNDGYPPDIKAGFVASLLPFMEDAWNRGMRPDVINIGGGYRRNVVEDPQEWAALVQDLEEALVAGKPTDIWGSYYYCMELTEQRTIKGREKALEKGSPQDAAAFIREMFADEALQPGRSLAETLRDLDITIQTEPGVGLLDHCGATLLRVIGTKKTANGAELVLVDGNIYNLSVARIYQYIADPILIGDSESVDAQPFGAYIAGNLCQENDILMRRKIPFPRRPVAGDILCFANTAPYFSCFEDASPHMHPRGASFVASLNSAGWSIVPQHLHQPSLISHDL